MSCCYKYLPMLIPQILLLAPPKSEVIMVSPWIDDVVLHPHIFGTDSNYYMQPKIYLSEFLKKLAKDYQMQIMLIVREKDYRFERTIAKLANALPDNLKVITVPYLHAKAVVTNSLAIETSANILNTSLFRNVELCTLQANHYRNPREWVRTRLGLIF